MENLKIFENPFQKDGKYKNLPEGWKKEEKNSKRMEKWKIFQKDGKSKNLPKGWKIMKFSRRTENQKIFQKDGNYKIFQKDGSGVEKVLWVRI